MYNLLLHHGTNDVFSRKILETGFDVQPVTRDDHWLGPGIYFFREDIEQALSWAIWRYRYDRYTSEYHVIETVVQVPEENFLNLDSRSGLNRLEEFYNSIVQQVEQSGVRFSDLQNDKLRHFVMKLLPPNISVIKRTFTGTSRFDRHDAFVRMELALNGVQVCVRNNEAITGDIKLVRSKVTVSYAHLTLPTTPYV